MGADSFFNEHDEFYLLRGFILDCLAQLIVLMHTIQFDIFCCYFQIRSSLTNESRYKQQKFKSC